MNPILTSVLAAATGALFAGLATWLFLRGQGLRTAERLAAREESLRLEQERAATREQQLAQLQQAHSTLQAEVGRLETRLQSEQRNSEEKLALLNEARTQLSDTFKALSAETLKSNNQQFLDLAQSTLAKFQQGARSDLEQRQKSIDQLVKPLHESLTKVDTRIQQLEQSRQHAYGRLDEQLKHLMETQRSLKQETDNLVKALRAPSTRGQWGEIQLRRVVEMAGMVNYCDFVEQETTQTEGGGLRPDLIIKLPNQKNIVVDAKVSLAAYLEAVEANDTDIRNQQLVNHARQVKTHLQQLSSKNYWAHFKPTPEFVVMFLPSDAIYNAALEKDPGLIEFGTQNKVLIATPTTLIALLRAVHFGWRQEQLAENAEKISELGREMYDRVATFSSYFVDLGKGLNRSVEKYNQAVGSLDTRVLVTARKFKELGAYSNKELETPAPIEQSSRSLSLPDDGQE